MGLQKKGDSHSLTVTRFGQSSNQDNYEESGHGHVFLAAESCVNNMVSCTALLYIDLDFLLVFPVFLGLSLHWLKKCIVEALKLAGSV